MIRWSYKGLRNTLLFTAILLNLSALKAQVKRPDIKLYTTTTIKFKYYVSLPAGWTKNKEWPVIIAVEEAEKKFRLNAERFAQSAGNLPFIIVSPVVTTNGNYGIRDPKIYPYSNADWNAIDKAGNCTFDLTGFDEMLKEVQQQLHGSQKVFLTGFESGTHIVWAYAFAHPEKLMAAIPVAGNFRNRCMDNIEISKNEAKQNLPIHNIVGSEDSIFGKNSPGYIQYKNAVEIAKVNGYKNISEEVIKGKGHLPLPDVVINYCYTLLKNR